MKIKKAFLVLLIVVLYSCSQGKEKKKGFYPSGNLKSILYYSDNKIGKDSLYIFYNLKDSNLKKRYVYKDSVVFKSVFYKNGNLFKKGNLRNGKKYGDWYYYNEKGFLSDIKKYMIIDDFSFMNQMLYFNKEEDTISLGSNPFNSYDQKEFADEELQYKRTTLMEILLSKDTIQIGAPLKAVLNYYTPLYENLNSKIRVYLGDSIFKLKNDVFNLKTTPYYKCLTFDTLNRKWYPDAMEFYDYMVVFGHYYDTPGKKILKGFMVEVVNDSLSIDKVVNKIYFKIPLYVKDTIQK